MTNIIDVQVATNIELPLSIVDIKKIAEHALSHTNIPTEITIRIVDNTEIQDLNKRFRNKDKPTNVLAFNADIPKEIELSHNYLGDVIIAPQVLLHESELYDKKLTSHWTHIITHGILHLLGYDHINEEDEKIMQALEIKLLKQLGIDDPYNQRV